MLKFKRIEIRNFAVFEQLEVEPSTDPDRPLTVIRAENGSGKTTFLRAVLWGMYGEKGLPGAKPELYSVHPAWWRPNEGGIQTTVTIELETDGSDRHDPTAGSRTDAYLLSRSVTTVRRDAARNDEPDFERRDEMPSLMKRVDSGAWEPANVGVAAAVQQLLPWDLRDFFVMDADQAADFVGGTENRQISVHEVERKTTGAVRSLLGIDVFEAAADRLRKAARNFGSEATRAVKNHKLDELQGQQDRLEDRVEQIKEELDEAQEAARDLKGRLDDCSQHLKEELLHQGAYESLVKLKDEALKKQEKSRNARREAATGLAGSLADASLFAPLASSALIEVEGALKPLHEAGRIPLKHIGFVRQLLETGECVCGRSLGADTDRRCRVEQELARAAEREDEAEYLGRLYEAAAHHRTTRTPVDWSEGKKRLSADIARASASANEASLELRHVEQKLDGIDQEKVQVLRAEEAALTTQLERKQQAVGRHELQLETMSKSLYGLRKRVEDAQRRDSAAADSSAARDLASLGARILDDSVAELRRRQVRDLSDRMNRLFGQMAANVTDADFEDAEEGRESVRMIARVGIRPVEDRQDRFGIFALNHRGRSMPPTEINGASRRVLALSFVLALCQESRTHAPLIADSLLNSMSGAVRRNTLDATVANSEQPILLLTGSDLEGEAEATTVQRFGGAVYTLTGQWDAVAATGRGGDVVRQASSNPNVAVLCQCGPRQFCDVCERQGQGEAAGWSRRTGTSQRDGDRS